MTVRQAAPKGALGGTLLDIHSKGRQANPRALIRPRGRLSELVGLFAVIILLKYRSAQRFLGAGTFMSAYGSVSSVPLKPFVGS